MYFHLYALAIESTPYRGGICWIAHALFIGALALSATANAAEAQHSTAERSRQLAAQDPAAAASPSAQEPPLPRAESRPSLPV